MVKHAHTIRRLFAEKFLSVSDDFVELVLKELS